MQTEQHEQITGSQTFAPGSFQSLQQQNFIVVNGLTLIFIINDRAISLLDFAEEVWENLLEHSKTLGITEVQFLFSSDGPQHMLTYQRIPTLVINHLKIHGEHIKTLKMINRMQNKCSYVSLHSVEAAKALRENGIYLEEVEVRSNSNGAKAFANALEHLATKGNLKKFSLTPLQDNWDSRMQISDDIARIQGIIPATAAPAQSESSEHAEKLFLTMNAKNKFQYLLGQGFIAFRETPTRGMQLSILISARALQLLRFPDVIWGDVLEYSKTIGINAIEFLFVRDNSITNSATYQQLPTRVINNLKAHGNHINSLRICVPTHDKRDYLSVNSIEAAKALKENGMHLEKVNLNVNSTGAKQFTDSLKHLAAQSKLTTAWLSPIEGEWNASHNIPEDEREIEQIIAAKKQVVVQNANRK